MKGKSLPLSLLAASCVIVSILTIVLLARPIVWICALGLAFCACGAIQPGSTARRVASLNIGFAVFLFGAAELYFSFGPEIRTEGTNLTDYTVPDEVLGYAPNKNHVTTIQRFGDDQLIYDVTYTIDEQGLRIAPSYSGGSDAPCILFFGGSFTFGEGLEDQQTLAYRVGVETDGRYRTYNFGFHGYGPHQMLAALETGLVESIIACRPRYIVYQGSEFHVSRAAGLSTWEKGGPHFELTEDGSVEFLGPFENDRIAYPDWLLRAFSVSRVLSKLSTLHRPANQNDEARYLGILETTRRFIESHYEGAEFLIVYWDKPDDPIAAQLEERGFRVHRVSNILIDRFEAPQKYQLHPFDGHPNALAMSLIAKHLTRSFADDATPSR